MTRCEILLASEFKYLENGHIQQCVFHWLPICNLVSSKMTKCYQIKTDKKAHKWCTISRRSSAAFATRSRRSEIGWTQQPMSFARKSFNRRRGTTWRSEASLFLLHCLCLFFTSFVTEFAVNGRMRKFFKSQYAHVKAPTTSIICTQVMFKRYYI